MSESDSDFDPYSSPLPIPGTSYKVQIGKEIDSDRWMARIVKGREIIAKRAFGEPELNGNIIIGFVMQELAIPMINPYQISKTVKMLIKQADRGPLASRPVSLEPPTPSAAPEPTPEAPASTTPAETEPVQKASEYDALMSPKPTSEPTTTMESESTGACPRCSTPVQNNFYFCPICSKQLKEKLCKGCGREIRPDYELCPYCGIRL
ncbi:MAG: hypothetical protein GF329_05690 [Candidatus Lokiarchaeota archaeon]|nr:hypothetical protein [Candidatus Lokiarchaeota archaeon]